MWNVIANDEKKLLLIKSDSTLDFFKIQEVLYHIYVKNDDRYSSYHRLIDLSALTDIDTHFDPIRDLIKSYRDKNPLEDNVKIAAHIPFGVTRAILEVYCWEEDLNANRYLISGSLDECVHFLSLDCRHRNPSEFSYFDRSVIQSFDQSP